MSDELDDLVLGLSRIALATLDDAMRETNLLRRAALEAKARRIDKGVEAIRSLRADLARTRALLRRAHDAMSRQEPDGISTAAWDQLLQDIEKEIGNG